MKEPIDCLSTLFVGIDIASRIHVISALDFNEKFYIKMKPVENTQEGVAWFPIPCPAVSYQTPYAHH